MSGARVFALASLLWGSAASAWAGGDGPGPRLSASIERAASGWDLKLTIAEFQFASDRAVAAAPRPGEGHVDLAVDGKRSRSLFETNAHIDPLPAGTHEIRVTLAGNDDKPLLGTAGSPTAARFLVWVPRSRPTSPPGVIRSLELAIAKGKVSGTAAPGTFRVTQGETLQIRWNVDEPVGVHLHGYDVEAALTPGLPTVMLIPAELPGRFSIETHGERGRPATVLHYVEVYPR
ncbi:MAG: hypothetical protein U1E56_08890 [Bauldia sp.]